MNEVDVEDDSKQRRRQRKRDRKRNHRTTESCKIIASIERVMYLVPANNFAIFAFE